MNDEVTDDAADRAAQQAILLGRVALRDRSAFRSFYDATSGRVFALAVRMLGNPALAEELTQEVYLKVWHAADGYRPERGTPMAWLTTIVRHRAIDMLRGTATQRRTLDAVEEPGRWMRSWMRRFWRRQRVVSKSASICWNPRSGTASLQRFFTV